MGNEIGRIEKEFILKAIEDSLDEMELHCNNKIASVIMLNLEVDQYIEVFSKDRELADFGEGDRISCYFSYSESVMIFYSKIISCDEEKAKIEYPSLCLRNLQRKNERLRPPRGLKLSFVMQNFELELGYPRIKSYFPVEDFEKSEITNHNIKDIISKFYQNILKTCDTVNVVFI